MKGFFMKHYNDSNEYLGKLQLLNLREREKNTLVSEQSKPPSTLKALKKAFYGRPNLNKELKIGISFANSRMH